MLGITGQLQDSQVEQSTQQLQQDDPDIIVVANSPQPEYDDELLQKVDIMRHCQSSSSLEEFIKNIHLSSEDLAIIERLTTDQSKCTLWGAARKGRISASNFYRAYTKVETMKKNPNTGYEALLKSLIDPPPLGHLTHIQHGVDSEATAIEQVITLLRDAGHQQVNVQSCGLFIDPKHQCLGASPDGVISCKCCGRMLLEIKSPSTDQPSCLGKDGKLKQKHIYFGQIQGQMMITNIRKCIFFVYYAHISLSHMEVVMYDESFCTSLRSNLCSFYEQCMAPSIINSLNKKRKLI